MSIEVRMPQESMAMLEGTVVQWFKSAGDSVLKGEPIAEIESDKATFEVAAPESGLLVSIAVGEGEVVPVRTVLATISGGDDVHDQTSSQEDPSERPGKGTQPVGASQPAGGSQPAAPTGSPQIVPAARRLAREHDIDLARVRGTGPGGRITEADVRATIDAGEDVGASGAVTSQVIALRGVRGKVAERMWASLQSMAQLTLITEVDVTELVRQREARESKDSRYLHASAPQSRRGRIAQASSS